MKACSFPGCTLAYRAKGWCSTHYKQAIQGAVRPVITRLSPIERLWRRVRRTDTCWLWEGATSKKGYGCIRVDGEFVYTHVLVFTHFHGPLLPGKEVTHSCDVRNCVRPEHLSANSHAGNMLDMAVRRRAPHAKVTVEEVLEIRRLKSEGLGPSALAERFGISTAHVGAIVSRRSYDWVQSQEAP